jgi:Zn-finger nucleic acid-binding protein
MRKLGLAAHYQRQVEIDVCEPCSLIWFDDTESARLAGPGLADLVRVIHRAMQSPRPLEPLPLQLPCPICKASLRRVSNISRFGRTAQLQCPQNDGAYQSFTQFLAEKGYFRAYTWGDIKQLTATGKSVRCFGCGATLESKPQNECSYCQSPVGMIDPARLARAIDIEEIAPKLALTPTMKQVSCPCCGGAINLVEEMVCPHCQAIVRPIETERALQASQSVETAVRENYAQQTEDVSRRKMEKLYANVSSKSSVPDRASTRRWNKLGYQIAASALLLYLWYSTHHSHPDMRLYLPDSQLSTTSEAEFRKQESAHVAEMMEKIPHEPTGVVPPMLSVKEVNGALEVTSLTKKNILVSALLVDEQFGMRCKSLISDDPHRGPTATFSKIGEVHTMVPYECRFMNRTEGKYEYEVWDLDHDRFIFASDSAFRHFIYNPTGLR